MHHITLLLLLLFASCQSNTPTTTGALPLTEEPFALLVQQNGQLIRSDYQDEKSANTLFNIQSVGKSIMALLIGIAIDEGAIESEQLSISQYFPQWVDSTKASITIYHLLHQSSGLEWNQYKEFTSWLNAPDQSAYVLQRPLVFTPGTEYHYHTGATHLLSGILTQATGMSTLEFAKEKLFGPLDIANINWPKFNDGYHDGGGLTIEMTAPALLKIGQLLLQEGTWNGQQLISRKWVNKILNPLKPMATDWGLKDSKYGYCWYTRSLQTGPVHYAMGYGGQFIFVLPSLNAVIVSTHEHDTAEGVQQSGRFLETELFDILAVLKERK